MTNEKLRLETQDNIIAIITTSDFYLEGEDVSLQSLFKPTDIFKVDFAGELPQVSIEDAQNADDSIVFTTFGRVTAENLTIDTQFYSFGVQFGDAKWRLEIIRQRRPLRLHVTPNNPDVNINFFFYDLTKSDQHTRGYDGSGGGLQRF